MNDLDTAMVLSHAGIIARRYARRCWWVDVEEVQAAATLEMVRAIDKYDGERGPEKGAYLWRVAVNAARRSVIKASSPVSTEHRLDNLKGHVRVSLATAGVSEEEPSADEVLASAECGEAVDVFEDIAHAELVSIVRERVQQLLGGDGAEFAITVIGGLFTPREVAEHNGVDVEKVYTMVRKLKDKLAADQTLWKLWTEL